MGKTPKEIISWCIWKHNNQMTGQNTQTQIDKIMDKEVYPKALAQLEEYYSAPSISELIKCADDSLGYYGIGTKMTTEEINKVFTALYNLITKRRGC